MDSLPLLKKAHFIFNPNSGGYKKSHSQLLRLLLIYGIPERQVHFTSAPGDATKIAGDISQKADSLIFAGGGDGTVNETVKGILQTSSILGIIPLGSGNGFARHLNIPQKPHKIFSNFEQAKIISADAGICDGKPFFVTSSMGFSAFVARQFDQFGPRGPWPYFLLTAKTYMKAKSFSYHLNIDGKTYEGDAFDITVANANQFGNKAKIAPWASIKDGLLEIAVIKKLPLRKIPIMATKLFSGKLRNTKEITYYRGKEISLTIEPQESFYHIDGEPHILNSDSIHWKIIPKAFRVLAF